jgi:hypothetical protein
VSALDLWECENCGQRAINGNGHGWTARGDERLHNCASTPERLLPRPAFSIDLTPVEQALVGMVRGMRRWAADEDGVHDEAWDAYVAAHKALKLPEPRESTFDDAHNPDRAQIALLGVSPPGAGLVGLAYTIDTVSPDVDAAPPAAQETKP